MQEYVYLGTKIGLFNNLNIERVVSRLERVEIGINNNMNSYSHTLPIRIEDENGNYVPDMVETSNRVWECKMKCVSYR